MWVVSIEWKNQFAYKSVPIFKTNLDFISEVTLSCYQALDSAYILYTGMK